MIKVLRIAVLSLAFAAAGPALAQAAQPRLGPALPLHLTMGRLEAPHGWTIGDLVQVRRIEGVAVRGRSHVTAFILKQPAIAAGRNLYGLYRVDPDTGDPAVRLVQAAYIRDLAWRPATRLWTFRADFGRGVQLYQCDDRGHITLLLRASPTVSVGASDGLRRDQTEGLRPVGVLSYEWSPDGKTLWYARPRLKPGPAIRQADDAGVVYDENRLESVTPATLRREARLAGTELRLLEPRSGADRLLQFRAATPIDLDAFRRDVGSTVWVDPRHIQYRTLFVDADGAVHFTLWRMDVHTGLSEQFQRLSSADVANAGPDVGGAVVTRGAPGQARLQVIGLSGDTVRDLGPSGEGRPVLFRSWRAAGQDAFIYATAGVDRNGLAALPQDAFAQALAAVGDDLEHCAFNLDLSYGACSRESLRRAPELVSVSGPSAALAVIASPNARYAAIAPLASERRTWINRYGQPNTGFVTYPRGFEKGPAYPAVVVTHARDARNQFANDVFQWELPVQVMAERGYVVLSVNEPDPDPKVAAGFAPDASAAGIDRLQFEDGFSPAASLEAAAQSLIDSGDVDPARIGVFGYSRGAEDATFVISHSRLFGAASIGDDPGRVAGAFWVSHFARYQWTNLFGGSPFDVEAEKNYRKYSISFRIGEVRTPVLQQFTAESAGGGMELDGLLKAAHVPTELVAYPGEAHIFFDPRHRASAMQRNLDWFDFWLLGRRAPDPDPATARQYGRWDAMRSDWLAHGGVAATPR